MNRLRILSVAALALPMALAAQQTVTTNPITTSFRTSGARYAGWLTAAFDSIPESRYGYKPTPAQLSIGHVATHLEAANYFLCSRFGGISHATTARDSLADSVKAAWPKDTLVTRLRASFAFCDDAMSRVDDAKLADELPAGPGATAPRARYVLGYVTDLVDHWSQMAIYMRLNGMIPPSALPRR